MRDPAGRGGGVLSITGLLCLLVIIGALLPFCSLQTSMVWSFSESAITLDVERARISAAASATHFREIEVLLPESPYAPIRGALEVRKGGETILRHLFDAGENNRPGSRRLTGDWILDQFVLGGHQRSVLKLPVDLAPPFEVRADVEGRSLGFVEFVLHGNDSYRAQIRRGFLNMDFYLSANERVLQSTFVNASPANLILGMLEYIVLGGLIAGLMLLVTLVMRRHRRGVCDGSDGSAEECGDTVTNPQPRAEGWKAFGWLFFAVSLGVGVYVALKVFSGLPHFQDDLCYLLRAKWLAHGMLAEQKPAFFDALHVEHTYFTEDVWLTIYPIGWPILLAVGELVGAAAYVPPVCGALGLVMCFALARRVYSRDVAIIVATLYLLCPLRILLSGSLLSHTAASLGILIGVYLLITGLRDRSWRAVCIGGMAFGYVFGIRPLTVCAVLVPTACFLLYELLGRASQPRSLRSRAFLLLAFVGGGIVGTVPVLWDNFMSTGDPLLFAYSVGKGHRLSLQHVPKGLLHADVAMALLPTHLNSWLFGMVSTRYLAPLTYVFSFLPFVLGKATKYDWLFLAICVAVPLAYLTHDDTGVYAFGPRFYFEAFPFYFLLTGRGVTLLYEVVAQRRISVATASVISLLFVGVSVPALCNRIPLFHGYNGVDEVLRSEWRAARIPDNAVVLASSFYQIAALIDFFPVPLTSKAATILVSLEVPHGFFGDRPVYKVEGNRIVPKISATGDR